MTFTEKLDKLMKDNNIANLNVLANKSKIPYTTLKGLYERGTNNIHLTTVKKLCKFFNTTLDYFGYDEITNPNETIITNLPQPMIRIKSFDFPILFEGIKNFDKLPSEKQQQFINDLNSYVEFVNQKIEKELNNINSN